MTGRFPMVRLIVSGCLLLLAIELAGNQSAAAQQTLPESLAAEPLAIEPTTVSRLQVGEAASQIQQATFLAEISPEQTDADSTAELTTTETTAPDSAGKPAPLSLDSFTEPGNLGGTLQVTLAVGVLSMVPAILLMTTSFVRIAVVLGMLRQAIGAQQLPPTQVMTALAIFMSILVMTPVWTRVYNEAVAPYNAGEIDTETAVATGVGPIRDFMSRQIEAAENSEDIWLFYRFAKVEGESPSSYDEVPLQVLLPAYLISELKVAFLIGFQIFLPFLVLDLIVSSVTVSLGMNMLPPATIAVPLKIMLFVLADGWRLIAGMLLESFAW